MKIQRLKILVLRPMLLSLPMMCMHAGDGHHSGGHPSSTSQPPYQSLIYARVAGGLMEYGETVTLGADETRSVD